MERFAPLILTAALFPAWQVGTLLARALLERDRSAVTGLVTGHILLVFALWLYHSTGLLGHFGLSVWFGIIVLAAFGAALGGASAVLFSVIRHLLHRLG